MLSQEVKEIIHSTNPDFQEVYLISRSNDCENKKVTSLENLADLQKENMEVSFSNNGVHYDYEATKDLGTGKVIFNGKYCEYNTPLKHLDCYRYDSIFKGPYHYLSHLTELKIDANFDEQGKLDGNIKIEKEFVNEGDELLIIKGSFAHGIPKKITKEFYDTWLKDTLLFSCEEKYDSQGALKKAVSFNAQTGTTKTTYDKEGAHTKVIKSYETLQKIIIAGCLLALSFGGIKACSNHSEVSVPKQVPQNQRG